MKMLVLVVVALVACSKKSGDAPAAGSATSAGSGSGSAETAPAPAPAAPTEDVSCKDAAKAYTEKMAATPGNVLSDAKPNEGLIHFTAISMEDYCVGEGGCCVPWTAAERACVKSAEPSAVSACFTGAALSQVNAGLNEVVTSALANKKANEAATGSGSGSGSGSAQ